eukprot:465933-Amphidinium_carterae.1
MRVSRRLRIVAFMLEQLDSKQSFDAWHSNGWITVPRFRDSNVKKGHTPESGFLIPGFFLPEQRVRIDRDLESIHWRSFALLVK